MTAVFVVFSFVFLASGVYAASTIGTNMSTTGTLTVAPAANSTTSVRFQNAAGTNYFFADSTNSRIGIGAAPSTKFEVQGTASASYLMTANSLQVFGVASVAYSRFGIGTTGHSLAAADDVLFVGLVEFNDNAFFDAKASISGNFQTAGRFILGDSGDTGAIDTSDWDISSTGAMTGIGAITSDGVLTVNDRVEFQGTASASYFLTKNTIQVGGAFASVAYSRFGTGETGHSLVAADDILVSGLVEFDDNVFFDAKASMSNNFQTSGRFIASGAASHSFAGDLRVTSSFVLGAASASSQLYVAEFNTSTVGTASYLFAGGGVSASTTGTCFQLKSTNGTWIYMRFPAGATAPLLSTVECR